MDLHCANRIVRDLSAVALTLPVDLGLRVSCFGLESGIQDEGS